MFLNACFCFKFGRPRGVAFKSYVVFFPTDKVCDVNLYIKLGLCNYAPVFLESSVNENSCFAPVNKATIVQSLFCKEIGPSRCIRMAHVAAVRFSYLCK